MQDFLFYFFSLLAVIPAVLVVTSRNPVNAAMFMILSMLSMAGMFVLLEAYFLAVLQVLVYAGAVMVLFLFIIMLLDVEGGFKVAPSRLMLLGSIVAGALMFAAVADLCVGDSMPTPPIAAAPEMPSAGQPLEFATSPSAYGYGLFTKYMLPFQVTGFMLLMAMVGVIVISKRMDTQEKERQVK